MSKSILISCDKEGKITVEAEGYVGGSCVQATQSARDALLGGPNVTRELKPEYHQAVPPQRIAESY